ncbi:MAG: folylpolyglutamate synthase/dihydrofolate synthase family protein [Saprospiraceae bacterium]
MSYQATLDYLFQQLPMFQRIGPAAFKKDLTNTIALCEALGNPQRKFKSIHIAGTNGKGSTAHMLAAVLQAAGYKVGLYTSPHYKDFRERIKVNGQLMKKSKVVDFVDQHASLFTSLSPSFFEITVALAFDYFAEQAVDFAVIETGLGGRLDSTNIILPELAIITNISFDHQQFLGDTLPLIAGEKAGIIKKGVPVVIGETQAETKQVFLDKARNLDAPSYFADQLLEATAVQQQLSHTLYDVKKGGRPWLEKLAVEVRADYQAKNIQTVLQSLLLLQANGMVQWTAANLRDGLGRLRSLTRFLGRWQILGEAPLLIVDSAHNEGGLQPTLQQLLQLPFEQLHIVMGMVSDKDATKVLTLYPPTARYYFAKADIPRGLDANLLRDKAREAGLHGRAYRSVRLALRAAKRHAKPQDVIFVGGSIFVVAEVV